MQGVSGALKEQHVHYLEVRARLFSSPPKPKHLMIVETPIMLAPIPEQRAWQREEVQQDWHVQQHDRRISEMSAKTDATRSGCHMPKSSVPAGGGR
jgi:hypothetical protein